VQRAAAVAQAKQQLADAQALYRQRDELVPPALKVSVSSLDLQSTCLVCTSVVVVHCNSFGSVLQSSLKTLAGDRSDACAAVCSPLSIDVGTEGSGASQQANSRSLSEI
jgi:hypothetical protein